MIIGCPVRKRDWILPLWHEHVLRACEVANVKNPEFVFACGTDDEPTLHIVKQWCDPILVSEPVREDRRDWHTERYMHMANIRNNLLRRVRQSRQDFFLSLDSDILLHPDAIKSMLENYKRYKKLGCWAVGGKTFMTTAGRNCPSYGIWKTSNYDQGIRRSDSSAVMPVGVLMAIKLMAPEAYNVNYDFHHWGEDLGWSANVARAGGKMWWDGTVANKHIMEPWMLDRIDKRCNF